MIRPHQIKALIEAGLPNSDVVVTGQDGRHFSATVKSAAFRQKSIIQQHRMVYDTLGEKMKQDIHALSLQTFTPEEQDSERGSV